MVAPVFNESDGLLRFHSNLVAALKVTGRDYEVIYVNDGSRDATGTVLESLRVLDRHVAVAQGFALSEADLRTMLLFLSGDGQLA